MAYELDFSGWSDARRAMYDSIINQANISANLTAQKYDTINKTASSLLKNALWAYGEMDQAAAEKAANTIGAANANLEQQGYTGLAVDPMQALSSASRMSSDPAKTYKRASLVNGLLRYE